VTGVCESPARELREWRFEKLVHEVLVGFVEVILCIWYYCIINNHRRLSQQNGQYGSCLRRALAILMQTVAMELDDDAQRARGEPRGANSDGSFAVRSSSRPARAEGEKNDFFPQ